MERKSVIMDSTQIKKELYRQKPEADFNYEENGFKFYSAKIEGTNEVIRFKIPVKECEFEETVPAQLLIRWLL